MTCTLADIQADAACVVCGKRHFTSPFPIEMPWLRECKQCAVRCVMPQPDDAEIKEWYAGAKYYATFGYGGQGGLAYNRCRLATSKVILEKLARWLEPGLLLDVGCGLGNMLAAARAAGWKADGIEANAFACEEAKRVTGAQVVCQRVEEWHAERSYDAVTCLEVIEHVREPDRAIERMRSALKKGGYLAITTPNLDSIGASVAGPHWVHYHRDHLWYFRRAHLYTVLTRAGFKVVECGPAYKVFTLRYVLSVLGSNNLCPQRRRCARMVLKWTPKLLLDASLPRLPHGLLVVGVRS